MNYMPGSAINEISQSLKSVTDGWSVNNFGTPAMPTPQSDLGYPNSISSTFGDNTLTNPAEIQQQESIVLSGQSFAAVPSLKMLVGEGEPITVKQPGRKGKGKAKTKNMVFPDQKSRKGKKQKSFILPKCLESFQSC